MKLTELTVEISETDNSREWKAMWLPFVAATPAKCRSKQIVFIEDEAANKYHSHPGDDFLIWYDFFDDGY